MRDSGESSGPRTASPTAIKSLTTSCVLENSIPTPDNVSWRRLAKPAFVPVLNITWVMHSRIVVICALFSCLPISSLVSLSVKLTRTGHDGRRSLSASRIITCASCWLRRLCEAFRSLNAASVESSACFTDVGCFNHHPPPTGVNWPWRAGWPLLTSRRRQNTQFMIAL